jgi:hypothetical protein
MAQELRDILSKYIPSASVDTVAEWILMYKIRVNITRSRASKSGDYRSPGNGSGHRISINHDLNPYHFLITFVHETAHLTAWMRHKDKNILPHGKEWKAEFQKLMYPLMHEQVFPSDVLQALQTYMQDPAATSCSDLNLLRSLRRYDTNGVMYVEDLPENCIFELKSGKTFIKGKKIRKLFHCREVHTSHVYHVHPMAEVVRMENPQTVKQ